MSRTTCLAFFSAFVWLHSAPALYPTPVQRTEQIQLDAQEAYADAQELTKRGVELPEDMNLSKQAWERGLRRSYWVMWVSDLFFVVFGLLTSYLIYANARYWPISVLVLCVIALLTVVPPTVESIVRTGSVWDWLRTWYRITMDTVFFPFRLERALLIYNILIWPLYPFVLIVFAISTMTRKLSNKNSLQA